MLTRLLKKHCAYCGATATDTAATALTLHGFPACPTCHEHFGADPDPERLARIRAYHAERRGWDRVSRRLTFGR